MADKHQKRITRQRRIILDELRKTTTHPTADEVYERVRKAIPRISLGTVYRNLQTLAAEGEIGELIDCGRMRFDWDTSEHNHIRCLACGRIDDLKVKLPAGIPDQKSGLDGYEVLGYKVEFAGICPSCARECGKISIDSRDFPEYRFYRDQGKSSIENLKM